MNKRIIASLIAACLCVMFISGCNENSSDVPESRMESRTEQTSQTTSETTQSASESTKISAQTVSESTAAESSAETKQTSSSQTSNTTQTSETSQQTTSASKAPTASSETSKTQPAKSTTAASKTTAKTALTKATAAKVKRVTGTSPNLSFYQSRLVVAGDSVAAGYFNYGYIPFEHNLAVVNVSVTAYRNYTFTATGQRLGIVESVQKMKPSLILTSMGANDCLISPALYGQRYRDYLKRLRAASPDSIILVGALTPTAQKTNYPHVSISVVRNFNAQLKAIADSMDENVIYFDAFSAVVEDNGVYMATKYAAFDGFHLQPKAYEKLLRVMAVTLDQHGAKDKIIARESGKKN